MKYPLSIAFIFITSVTLSYYLLNNPNFLPVNTFEEYNWINILTLIFLLSIALFTLTNLLAYLIQIALKKYKKKNDQEKEEQVEESKWKKEIIVRSIKISTLVTTGTISVFTLNYLHILNITWGLIILLVVLIFTFII